MVFFAGGSGLGGEKNGKTGTITRLLKEWNKGEGDAYQALFQMVHKEMMQIARSYLNKTRRPGYLQTQSLVQETCLALLGKRGKIAWKDRKHFYCLVAMSMRRVIADLARKVRTEKRGGEWHQISLDENATGDQTKLETLIAIDQLLKELETLDPLAGKVVELKFFGGYTIEESASLLEVSPITVNRKWKLAKTYFYSRLKEGKKLDSNNES